MIINNEELLRQPEIQLPAEEHEPIHDEHMLAISDLIQSIARHNVTDEKLIAKNSRRTQPLIDNRMARTRAHSGLQRAITEAIGHHEAIIRGPQD